MPPKSKKTTDNNSEGEDSARGREEGASEPRPRSASRPRNETIVAQLNRAQEEQNRRFEAIMNTLQQQSEVMEQCMNTVGAQGREMVRLRNQVEQLPTSAPVTLAADMTTTQPLPATVRNAYPPQTLPTAAYPPVTGINPGDRIMTPSSQGFQPASVVTASVRPLAASAATANPVVNQPRTSGAQGGPLPLDHTPLVQKPAVMDLLNQRGGPGAPPPARSASAPRQGARPTGPPPNGRPMSQSPPVNRNPGAPNNQIVPYQGVPQNNPVGPNNGPRQNNYGPNNHGFPPNNANGYQQPQQPNNAPGYQQPLPPNPPAPPAAAPNANQGNYPQQNQGAVPGPRPAMPQHPGPQPAMPGAGGGGGGDGGDGDGNGPNGPNNNQYGMGYRAARAARNNNGVPQVGLLDPAVRERGKVLSQIRLPKFSNRSTTDHWIQQVREAHLVYNTTDQEIIYVAKNAMHGEVAAAVRDLNTADMTLEEFFGAIRREVLPTDNRAHARAALTGLFQGKKDLYDFKHHTLSLTMRAHDLELEDAQRIGVLSFIGGLADEDISDKVLDKDPQTIEEAYILADRFQAIARDKARRKRLSAVYKSHNPDDEDDKEVVDVNFMKKRFEANKTSHKDLNRDLGAKIDRRFDEVQRVVTNMEHNHTDDMQRLYNEVKKQQGKGNKNDKASNDNKPFFRGKENQKPFQKGGGNRLKFTSNNQRDSGNKSYNNNNNNNNRSSGPYKRNWTPRDQQRMSRIHSHIRHLMAEADDQGEEADNGNTDGAVIADMQGADDALRAEYGSEDDCDDDDGAISDSDEEHSSN